VTRGVARESGVAVPPDVDDGLGVDVACAGVAVLDLSVGVGVAVPFVGVDVPPVASAVVLDVGVMVALLVGLVSGVAVVLAESKF
jgi:hypothetical protein